MCNVPREGLVAIHPLRMPHTRHSPNERDAHIIHKYCSECCRAIYERNSRMPCQMCASALRSRDAEARVLGIMNVRSRPDLPDGTVVPDHHTEIVSYGPLPDHIVRDGGEGCLTLWYMGSEFPCDLTPLRRTGGAGEGAGTRELAGRDGQQEEIMDLEGPPAAPIPAPPAPVAHVPPAASIPAPAAHVVHETPPPPPPRPVAPTAAVEQDAEESLLRSFQALDLRNRHAEAEIRSAQLRLQMLEARRRVEREEDALQREAAERRGRRERDETRRRHEAALEMAHLESEGAMIEDTRRQLDMQRHSSRAARTINASAFRSLQMRLAAARLRLDGEEEGDERQEPLSSSSFGTIPPPSAAGGGGANTVYENVAYSEV